MINIYPSDYSYGIMDIEKIDSIEAKKRIEKFILTIPKEIEYYEKDNGTLSDIFNDNIDNESLNSIILYTGRFTLKGIDFRDELIDILRELQNEIIFGPFIVSYETTVDKNGFDLFTCDIIFNRINYTDDIFNYEAHNYISFDVYKNTELESFDRYCFDFPANIDDAIEKSKAMLEFFERMKAINKPLNIMVNID